jgi:hypothetical protein
MWQTPLKKIAWAVNISGDGKLALAALGDGTIRWFRMNDGKELLALFPHADKKRWVLWNSSGYHDASPGGEGLIGWHLNNGNDQAASFFPADSLRADYYRPDVIAKIFNTPNESETVLPAIAVSTLRLPLVEITSLVNGASVSSDALTIRFAVRTPAADPVISVHAFVDGQPAASRVCSEDKSKDGDVQELTFTIPKKDCEVAITAENRFATSVPSIIRLKWSGPNL